VGALKKARAVSEGRAGERAARERVEDERKVQAREARKAAGKRPGREPKPPQGPPEASDQYNFTDPESRIMKAGTGGPFEQTYNAQGVVAAEGRMLILGAHVSAAPNDKEQLAAGVASVEPGIRQVAAGLVDSGFYSAAAVAQVEAPREDGSAGPVVYAAMTRARHHRTLEKLAGAPEPEPLGEAAGIKGANGTPAGHRGGTCPLQAAQANRGARLRDHQGSHGIPALQPAWPSPSESRMAAGLRGLQRETVA
jgi:hypothetical protein